MLKLGARSELHTGNDFTVTKESTIATVEDRLSCTLFVAALFHGIVILGVTFSAGPLGENPIIPTLKITLITDANELDIVSEDAEYLAQRNQRGTGERELGNRPTTTLASTQLSTQANDQTRKDPIDNTPRALITRYPLPEKANVLSKTDIFSTELPQTTETPIQNASAQTLAREVDFTASLLRQEEDTLPASPDTRASTLAAYMNAWRRRVERIGTANFPVQAHTTSTNPILEVTIGTDGQLENSVVRKSSGNSALDQAALNILYLAAPFDPLPQSLRAQYDVLKFAYEWDFRGGADTSEID